MSIKKEVDQKKILKDFLDENEIEITRFRRNKDDRMIDLAPMIYNGRVLKDDVWEFTISTGSSGNVRPQEVIRALKIKSEGSVEEIPLVNIERLGMFIRKKDKLYKPINRQVLKKEVRE